MTNDERTAAGWIAGLDSKTGVLAFNVLEHSCYSEFVQAARKHQRGDTEIDLYCFTTDADIHFFFNENHKLLLDYAEKVAHDHRLTRLMWLSQLDYKNIPKQDIYAAVQTSIIDNKPTQYDDELQKVFIHAVLVLFFEDIEC